MYFRIDTAGTSNNEVNEEPSKEDSSKFKYIQSIHILFPLFQLVSIFFLIRKLSTLTLNFDRN